MREVGRLRRLSAPAGLGVDEGLQIHLLGGLWAVSCRRNSVAAREQQSCVLVGDPPGQSANGHEWDDIRIINDCQY